MDKIQTTDATTVFEDKDYIGMVKKTKDRLKEEGRSTVEDLEDFDSDAINQIVANLWRAVE